MEMRIEQGIHLRNVFDEQVVEVETESSSFSDDDNNNGNGNENNGNGMMGSFSLVPSVDGRRSGPSSSFNSAPTTSSSSCLSGFCGWSTETTTTNIDSDNTKTVKSKLSTLKTTTTLTNRANKKSNKKKQSITDIVNNTTTADATVDEDLTNDLTKLSMKERNTLLEDIHGVHSFEQEDVSHVKECMDQIHLEIVKIPNSNRVAYNKANFLAPTRVSQNSKLLKMFLRASSYDPKISAKRLIKYFDYKLRLFGPDKLNKDIAYDDLSQDDIEALYSGYSLKLPGKDSTGRMVWVMASKYINCKSWENQLRANWYQLMTAIQDESIQIRGSVLVSYEIDQCANEVMKNKNLFLKERLSSVNMYLEALPLRTASVHNCFNNPSFKTIINLYKNIFDNHTKQRLQFHCGNHMECQYELLSFGIPTQLFLFDYEGNMKPGIVDMCVQQIRNESNKYFPPQSSSMSKFDDGSSKISDDDDDDDGHINSSSGGSTAIEIAKDTDVLLGRGVPYQKHPANARLAKIIEERMDEFVAAPKFQKTIITWEIVKQMKEDYGARFLEKISVIDDNENTDIGGTNKSVGTWKICNDEAARYKVAVGFRSNIKMERRRRRQRADEDSNQIIATPASSSPIMGADEKRRKIF